MRQYNVEGSEGVKKIGFCQIGPVRSLTNCSLFPDLSLNRLRPVSFIFGGMLAPILTPQGRLFLENRDDALRLEPDLADRLKDAFSRGPGHGLLHLGAVEVQTVMPAVFMYWREFSSSYLVAVRTLPGLRRPRSAADSSASAC